MRRPEVAPEGDPTATPKGTRIKAATRAVRMPELLLGMGPRRWRRLFAGLVVAIGGAAGVTAIVNAIRACVPYPDHRRDIHRWPLGRLAMRGNLVRLPHLLLLDAGARLRMAPARRGLSRPGGVPHRVGDALERPLSRACRARRVGDRATPPGVPRCGE